MIKRLLCIGSAHSKMSMKNKNNYFSANPSFVVKKKENPIDLIRRQKHFKRQISWQRSRWKEGRWHPQTRNSNSEGEREREAKLKTMHHSHWLSSSLLWRKQLSRKSPNTTLLSALITPDWPHVHKSNNPTTIKHRTFFHFLIPYQHIYSNPVIWTFYLFVFNTIVKIFTCFYVLFLQLCFCSFLVTICWYIRTFLL